ncbi:hypothetical protein Lal_00041132 [Lupinus albus]|nr:hypothetical protein Lal_00041132 [Lupinus albus]
MGKRKAKTKPPPKKRMDKLDTVFSCPFCNHGSSVECRIDMKNLIGEASCGICQESFSTTITALSEAIDIYSEWIDECERVNTVEDDVPAVSTTVGLSVPICTLPEFVIVCITI